MKSWLFFLILLFSMVVAQAEQSAVVIVDGAMVYKGASFDAPVIAYFEQGKQINISNKIFGPFYKVRVRPGVVGFISDIDVKITNAEAGTNKRKNRDEDDEEKKNKGKEKNKDKKREKDAEEEGGETNGKPVFKTKYFGLLGGAINYRENVFGQKVSANQGLYGVKISGPGLVTDGGTVFDFSLYFSLTAPSYYKDISTTPPSGMIAIADLEMILPYIDSDPWVLYFGIGPVVAMSRFTITFGGQRLEFEDVKLGGAVSAGLAYRHGKTVFKLEPKYILTKESYVGAFGSIQRGF